ncbi:YciK family oxidoreductase [Pseudomonadales bacterium]|nr:YciK family oxidoreductase [Pseudomonadales bacterium]MDA9297507.1 YciK family oxidoreductase [Pseudomonadales bacterium]MDB4150546.1 YciK family oxidoreductase [Pseudomonadales bacterium]
MDYQAPQDLLAHKVILVTGAGAGIGRVAATTFASHGATVVLLGKTTAKLEQVYDEIMALGAPEPGIAPMDLATASSEDIKQLAEVLDSTYGRLDGLLHNAAMLGDRIPVEHYDINQWMTVMQVNFNAVFMLTRLLLPLLRQAPAASLLFTSSSVGAAPKAYWGPYAVSKYAMEGLAKLLAEELDNTSAIRVNIINPGATRTSMRAKAYPNENPANLKTATSLMPLYLYLMGDDSSAVNGETLTAS